MPFAELPTGARLHYIDTNGEGVPFILVHGLLGTAEMNFSQVIEWLRPDYRVIGPTLRGFGQSEPKPRDFPHDFYQLDARDVLALMDHLNIRQAHILGYSDGGEAAMLAAAYEPKRFLSVATIGSVGYFGPAMRPIIQTYFPGEWITQEEREAHNITDTGAFILGWVQSLKRIIDSGGDLSLSLAHNITAPMLLMLGTKDRLNPVEYGQQFIDKTPNGKLATFNTGHGIHEEAWDEFKRVYGEFLATIS